MGLKTRFTFAIPYNSQLKLTAIDALCFQIILLQTAKDDCNRLLKWDHLLQLALANCFRL